VTDQDIDEHNIDLFLNTPYQKDRRLEMLQGTRHSDCKSCWSIEDQGATSLRGNSPDGFIGHANHIGMFNEFAEPTLDYVSKHVNINSKILESNDPFMLEVSIGNTCDMKCMYCNHVYSSQWATESLKNGSINIETYRSVQSKPNQKFLDMFWKWVDSKAKHSLNRIGIIGGEPLISPEFYEFIDKLLEVYKDREGLAKTRIWVVTNLNSTDAQYAKFLEYIPKITKLFTLEVHVSMEAMGEQAEYIRNGLDWNRFENNVNKLFKSDVDIEIAFLPSITALSIPRFTTFLKWVYDLSIKYNKPVMLKQNIVTYPGWQTPFILPNNFATYLNSAIDFMAEVSYGMPEVSDKFGTWPSYTAFLVNLRSGIQNSQPIDTGTMIQFAKWFDEFDSKRNLNLIKTFPEFEYFYKACKEVQ
jgi:pyruvate-formate lyase-activating enzyme